MDWNHDFTRWARIINNFWPMQKTMQLFLACQMRITTIDPCVVWWASFLFVKQHQPLLSEWKPPSSLGESCGCVLLCIPSAQADKQPPFPDPNMELQTPDVWTQMQQFHPCSSSTVSPTPRLFCSCLPENETFLGKNEEDTDLSENELFLSQDGPQTHRKIAWTFGSISPLRCCFVVWKWAAWVIGAKNWRQVAVVPRVGHQVP